MIKILLVDDHVLFREGLSTLLSTQPDIRIVGTAETIEEAIEKARILEPDLVLMDFNLPDGSGVEATQAILAEQPGINIIFLTVHDEDERLFEAIQFGASGYLIKNISLEKLLEHIHGAMKGDAAITPAMTKRILNKFSRLRPYEELTDDIWADLTPREREVLYELQSGATNQEIADRLFISTRTVQNHVSSILAKLDVKNRYEAARFARHHKLTRD